MCTHQRWIFNRYTHTQFLAKCGKCKACLQEKAYKRAYRIKCEQRPDRIALFVTLTYDRGSCPFVYKSDVRQRLSVLPVYREFSTRRVRRNTRSGLRYLDKRTFERVKLTDILFPDYDSFLPKCDPLSSEYQSQLKKMECRSLAYRPGHIGICYYPDVQLFKKRLNINLKRIYNYEGEYKVYSCSEYGERSGRPHFHLLIFIPASAEATFRAAISQAWPFASHRRTERYIEIARDAANYVASYVNSGSNVHGFLTSNFKCKHSYSKDFGMGDKLFTLDSILQKIEKRDLSYTRGIGPKGQEVYVNFCIPKYVLNRYFPLFKGYSCFTDVEVLDVLRSFIQPGTGKVSTPLISLDKLLSIDYTKDDIHKYSVRLCNSYRRFCHSLKGLTDLFPQHSVEDYIRFFVDCWKIYKITNMRLWYDDSSVDPKYKYDNTQALRTGFIYSPDTLDYLDSSPGKYIDNPNEYPQNVNITSKYSSIFDFRCKERKINNFVMAKNNYYF